MKPSDKLHNWIKKLHVNAGDELDARVRRALAPAPAEESDWPPASRQPSLWRIVMTHPFTRRSVAAVVVLVGLTIVSYIVTSNVTTPVYGITESLEMFRTAKTLHVKGWSYLKTGRDSNERKKFPFEHWVDKMNGRFREWRPTVGYGVDGQPNYTYFLTISDGRCVLKISDSESDGDSTARFQQLDPLEQRLQAHRLRTFGVYFIGPLQLHPEAAEEFSKSGTARIDGELLDVWDRLDVRPGGSVPHAKQRVWFSPSTGRIARMQFWENPAEAQGDWEFTLSCDLHTIRYDAEPPVGCFDMEVPDGVIQTNTKETAPRSRVITGTFNQSQRYYEYIGFTLPDGSVIVLWPGFDDGPSTAFSPFENLGPGDSLPKLPVQVTALTPWPTETDVSCPGYHLARTYCEGKSYEWSIHVPNGPVPSRSSFTCYKMALQRHDGESESDAPEKYTDYLFEEVQIESEEDFNDSVLRVMAELNPRGDDAPKSISYESVMKLITRLRQLQ